MYNHSKIVAAGTKLGPDKIRAPRTVAVGQRTDTERHAVEPSFPIMLRRRDLLGLLGALGVPGRAQPTKPLLEVAAQNHITGAMPLHLTIWRPAEVWHHLGALRILR